MAHSHSNHDQMAFMDTHTYCVSILLFAHFRGQAHTHIHTRVDKSVIIRWTPPISLSDNTKMAYEPYREWAKVERIVKNRPASSDTREENEKHHSISIYKWSICVQSIGLFFRVISLSSCFFVDIFYFGIFSVGRICLGCVRIFLYHFLLFS